MIFLEALLLGFSSGFLRALPLLQYQFLASMLDSLGGLILLALGVLVIVVLVAAAIVLLPAIVLAVLAFFLTGSLLLAGIVFLGVGAISMVAMVDD